MILEFAKFTVIANYHSSQAHLYVPVLSSGFIVFHFIVKSAISVEFVLRKVVGPVSFSLTCLFISSTC